MNNCQYVREALHCTQQVFGVCIPVCVSLDSGKRSNPISFKFGINDYVICKFSCAVLGGHCLNNTSTETDKNISVHCGLLREIFVSAFKYS